ncbi:MAG: glycosyltransferase family 39 protein [Cyanobacteria bacterium]|nr:glycosyltransferase family 39 protein [Cyanobacteriota bacterium]
MPADRRRLIALLIWAAYFIIPSDAGGVVGGWPLGPLEAAPLVAIGWLAIYGGRLPLAPAAAAMLIITTASGWAIPGSPGFRARYFTTIDATGAPERSGPFSTAFTRIDSQLHFEPGGNELPLNFFNDNSRFSFFQVRPRDRNQLEFSVRWSGFWWVPNGAGEVYVDAPGATGEVFVDGEKQIGQLTLSPGWHRLDVSLSSPYGAPRRFSAGTTRGVPTPFDSLSVYTQQIREWQVQSARALRIVRTMADLAALGLVLIVFAKEAWRKVAAFGQVATDRERREQAIAIFAAVAAIDALRFAWPWATRVMILVGGDDTLTYESYARDILFNGILMSGGQPLGQGEPFYYQAFYPYFLAATHFVFGEFMFGALLVQRLLAALAIVKLVEIAIRFTAERVSMVALPIATAFIGWKFWHIAGQPLNESLYVPLLVASAAALIRLCDHPSAKNAGATGIVSGFATITRSTALLSWAIVWPAAWLALKGQPKRTSRLAMLIASFLAVLSLVAIRNWIVAGVPSPIPTEGAITLLGGNEPPAGLTISPERHGVYQRFGISDITATVIEYAITEPRLFALNLWRKALFVLGFYEPYAPGWGYSPVYILTWTLALAGLWLAIKHRHGSIWPILIPALIAATQFIAIVIVYPKGERLVVPIHTMLIPYTAIAVWHVAIRLRRDGKLSEST